MTSVVPENDKWWVPGLLVAIAGMPLSLIFLAIGFFTDGLGLIYVSIAVVPLCMLTGVGMILVARRKR